MRTTPLTPRQPSGQSSRAAAVAKIQQPPPPTPGPSTHKPAPTGAPFAARSLVRSAPPNAANELEHESAWGDDECSEFGDGASEASFYSIAHECGVDCACSDTDDDSVATVLDTPDVTIPSPTATITSLPDDDNTPKKDEVSVGWSEKSWGTVSPRNPSSADQQHEYGLLSNHARKQLEDLGPDWKPDWAKVHQPVAPLDPTSPEFEDLLVRAWVAIHDRWKAKVAEATRTLSHYTPIMLFQSTEPQEITLRIVHLWIDVCDCVDNLAVIASYLWFDEAGKLPPPPAGYDAAAEEADTMTPRYPKLQQAKRDYPVPRWAFEDGAEYIMKRQSPVYSITSSPRIPPRILQRLLAGDIPDARIYYPLWVPPQTKSSWLWWF